MSEDGSEQDRTQEEREEEVSRNEREHRRVENGDQSEEISGKQSGYDQDTEINDQTDIKSGLLGKKDEELDVPQVKIEKSSRPNAVDQETEIPAADQAIQVPKIETDSTSRLDTEEMIETVQTGSEGFETDIPQFSLSKRQRIKPVELDEDELEGLNRVQKVRIPQVKLGGLERIYPFSTFLETIPEMDDADEEINAKTLEEESVDETQEAVTTQRMNEGSPGVLDNQRDGSWAEDELPDPLELLLGSSGADIQSDNPIIALVDDDSLIGVVETLVKRRYREIEGGEPDLQKFDTADRLTDEERWISADGQIFTAQMIDEEWEKLERDEYQEDWQSIYGNRIDQLFSGQKFGAIIFNNSELPDPETVSAPYHPPTTLEIEGRVNWGEIADIFWTDLDSEELGRGLTFSQVFDWKGNGVAQDRVQQVLKDLDGKLDFATEQDDAASEEHYQLKVFVVKWLVDQLWESETEFVSHDKMIDIEYREIEDTIQTEKTLKTGDEEWIRPDIMYGSQVFEVEMFFGESVGGGIAEKLQRTVRKYEEVGSQVDTINVVLDNLTCLLHLKELARFKRVHRAWEEDHAEINLYTIDLGDQELVPISEIADQIPMTRNK